MCGIAGYIAPLETLNTEKKSPIHVMLDSLKNRGPDGEGIWQNSVNTWSVTLGHRRLSIIDLEGGKQPFALPDAKYVTTYNGEIFNFLELKKSLEAKGFSFQSASDTEVVLQMFKAYGPESLVQLNGMFAFAIWDHDKKSLYLARDRVGIKPLYYAPLAHGGLVFASDLKTLLRSRMIPLKIDSQAVLNYFFSEYSIAPHSFIEGVYKLEPGHYLKWHDGQFEVKSYFKTFDFSAQKEISFTDAETKFEKLFWNAVDRQLISDVPVGILLSGGLDSSAITHAAQQISKKPLQTFSIEFSDTDFDESALSRFIAEKFHTRHHALKVDEASLLSYLDTALSTLDEPMADPSILPTFIVSRLAASNVKVVLGGDGGDELFGGYPTYFAHQIAQHYKKVPTFLHQKILHPCIAMLPVSERRWALEWKLKRFFNRWSADDIYRHLNWMAGTPWAETFSFIKNLEPQESWAYQLAKRQISQSPTTSLQQYMLLDFMTYLPNEVLVKVDRATMACGLESRPPFLDNDLMNFAFSLPDHLKIHGRKSKILIRNYVEKYIGKQVSQAPKKGFGIPLNRWLRNELKEKLQRCIFDSPIYDYTNLKQEAFVLLWEEHLNKKKDHSRTLWAFYVFHHWLYQLLSPGSHKELTTDFTNKNSRGELLG